LCRGSAPRWWQHLVMIEDRQLTKAFSEVAITRNWTNLDVAYELRDFRWSPGLLDVEVAQRNGQKARLRIDLPSSNHLQPWLYRRPEDAADWVASFSFGSMRRSTRMVSGSVGSDRERRRGLCDCRPYGWRVVDIERHERLSAAAGPFGWHNDVRP